MQTPNNPIFLNDRAILTLTGADSKNLLQGLITNDIGKLSQDVGLYAALLTSQGKYIHDFFITEQGDTLYLDCEKARRTDLFRRLMMYRLRAEVEINDCSEDYYIFSAGESMANALISYADPRCPEMGFRNIVKDQNKVDQHQEKKHDYDLLRLKYGLPDGSRDFDVEKTLILEGNMEELNGVDFNKGCYVGQEVTARMKHRTNLKKRLLPVKIDGELPERGTDILNEAGKKIGDIRSGRDHMAIGYFRLADVAFNRKYSCGDSMVTPWQPPWLKDGI